MKMKFAARMLSVMTVSLGIAGAATAGSCGYEYCWGAVAVGPNGAYGFAHSWGSEQQALDTANAGCEWDCTIARTFYNSCAAIAVADNGGWGWAYESSRELAESSAMNYCMDNGYNCRVRVWSCSQ